MSFRCSFIIFLCIFLSNQTDGLISTQSCADIIRPSQTYVPADPTLKINTIPSFSYQECGKQCRITTLCRTAVWCQGQCTMYQEYIVFGTRLPNLECMLITLSGIAFNEIEPIVSLVSNVVYQPSQSKYYESTYTVDVLDDCVQLCRLDSHCLTASYQSSTNNCSLFAEHVSQGQNYTNADWTTIILDTCVGRDSRIYPCLIDATQADIKLCDLLKKIQPSTLDLPLSSFNEFSGYSGWLTKSSVYWPATINGENIILRTTYDMAIVDRLIVGLGLGMINTKYIHINVNQYSQTPFVSIAAKSYVDNRIYQVYYNEQNATKGSVFNEFAIDQHCHWCYFAIDGSQSVYVSMDTSDMINQYDNSGALKSIIYVSAPRGIVVRNHKLWIVNSSQLIILNQGQQNDQSVSYYLENQIDLASLYKLSTADSSITVNYSTFIPFHLDVDNYGRIYIVGTLTDLDSDNNWIPSRNNPYMYVLADGKTTNPSVICSGQWGAFGVNVYHSKLKLRMLTSTTNLAFKLYTNS